MAKASPGKGLKTPWGLLRSLTVSLPVLETTVVTFRPFDPSALTSGVEILTVKLGAREAAGAAEMTMYVTRVMRGARRKVENITMTKVSMVVVAGAITGL